MGDVEKVKVKIDGDSKGLNKALDSSKGHSKSLEKALMGAKFAAAAAFAAVGAGAVASVANFAKFDHSIRGVKTLLDETSFGAKGLEKGFAKMRKEILNVGRTTPVEIESLNKALFDTVSAGVEAGAAVDVVAASARLAVAGLTDVSVATDGMTSAMNAYAFEADEAEMVSSKFFAAQKAGKTTIAELSGGFGLVGDMAAAAGVEFNELLAATSAMTLTGASTSMVYTRLKAVIGGISKPTADATKEAKRLNIEFNAGALRAKGLKQFMDDLRKANGFTKDSITKLFGSLEGQNAAMALTGGQAEAFSKILGDLGDDQKTLNDLTGAYEEQADSMQNKWKILTNRAEVFSIQLGKKLAPTLIKVIDYMSDLFDVPAAGPTARLKEINVELEELNKKLAIAERGITGMPDELGFNTTGSRAEINEARLEIEKLKEEAKGLREELGTPSGMKDRLKEISTEMASLDKQMKRADEGVTIISDAEFNKLLTKFVALREESDALTASLGETPLVDTKADALAAKLAEEKRLRDEAKAAELASKTEYDAAVTELDLAFSENKKAMTEEEYQNLKQKLTQQRVDDIKEKANALKREGKHGKAKKLLQDAADKQTLASHKQRRTWETMTAQQQMSTALSTSSQLMALQNSSNSKMKAIGKSAAIVNIGISTAEGAIKAYTSLAGIPIIGPALGAAAAAALIAYGAEQTGKVMGFSNGGAVSGSGDIPIIAHDRELIAPARNFDEVVEATARGRGFIKEDETSSSPVLEPQEVEVKLSMSENLIDFVEAQINERRSLGVSTI